ncbi:MAG: flagellar assembly protein FliW [Oscillospiraceae bacterium]|nr:flagellar assembly protein FliW [Oscillospiraceae bacterium]
MKIKTKYFGDFEVAADEILHFKRGLFGFEDMTSFTLIPFEEENDASFLCLQSTEDEELAFILFNPFFIDPDYNPKLQKEDIDDLKIGDKTPVAFLAITVIYEKFEDSTANMKCPIVINNDTRQAKQLILEQDFSMRRRINALQKEAR